MPREGVILLVVIALGWGVNWTMMKLALAEIPPLSFRACNTLIGGAGLLVVARLNGISISLPRKYWRHLFWMALFNNIGWNVLSTYSLRYLPSGRAALLAYTMPLWCVPLSMWLLHELLGRRRLLALILGFAGVLVLMGRSFVDLSHAPIGVLLMLAAAASWSTGVVLLKYWQLPVNITALTGWITLSGGVPIAMGAWFVDGVPLQMPGFWPLVGVAYGVLIAAMLCGWAWNRLVLLVPVAVSSLSSLITPLIGIASGMLFLGEQLGWQEAVAAVLIVGSVAVINLGRARVVPLDEGQSS